jgi:dTDP-4-dehydrorhamnose 3,5-epimerase
MKATATALPGVVVIEPDVYRDERGFFLESYQRARYADVAGIDVEFVQDNHSRSARNVLRGLHLQRSHPQGKLVRVTKGEVWDVAVDVDPRSPTFLQWHGVHLTADNHLQMYIPPGYAHGFCVLSELADFEYKCTEYYRRDDEVGILWNDPELAIAWPVAAPVLSARDAANPSLREFLQSAR